jgi:predicted nuclease of predicted toxin-antitoxin system
MPSFFADECVAGLIVEGLRKLRHDVADAKQVCKGEEDTCVLSLAAAAGRIVITDDRGVGEMIVRHGQPAAGVIFLCLYALSAGAREACAIKRIADIADSAAGHLNIIEPVSIRTRSL